MVLEADPSYEFLKADIGACLNSAANDFFRIGYCLRQVKERELYLADGHRSIWEFAQKEYGLSMSSASRFMAINARFSVDGGEKMDPKYIGMGPSRLQEMLGLPEEELEKITPDTPVREIRRLASQAKSIETLAKQCEAAGSCPDETHSCIAGDKVGTEEGKELCTKCWKDFLKSHPDWEPGVRMEEHLESQAKGDVDALEPRQEEPKSFFGLPKTVYPEDSLISTEGCGDGKYACFCCARPCSIRQKERYCMTAPLGNPFPCTQMNAEKRLDIEAGFYSKECQHLHPELSPVRGGDKEPDPCCITCEHKTCVSRCSIAKERDKDEKKQAQSEQPKQQHEAENRQQGAQKAARPEPTKKDIKAFYHWIRHWISEQPDSRIDAAELKGRYRNAGGGGQGFSYEGSSRGVTINSKKEITWNEAAKRLKEIQEEEREAPGRAEASEYKKSKADPKAEEDRRLLDFYRAVYPSTRQIIAERDKPAITRELKTMYGSTYENGEGWYCFPDKIVFRDRPGAELLQITWGRFTGALVECLDRFPEVERQILFANGEESEVVDADFREIEGAAAPERPEEAEIQHYSISDVERLMQKDKTALDGYIKCMEEDEEPTPMLLKLYIYVDALELLIQKMNQNMHEDMEGGGLQ